MLGEKEQVTHLQFLWEGGDVYLKIFSNKTRKKFHLFTLQPPHLENLCNTFFANFLLVNILKEKLCWGDLTRLIQKVPSGKLLSWLPKSFELPSSKTFDWYFPSATCLHWKRTRVQDSSHFQCENSVNNLFAAVFTLFSQVFSNPRGTKRSCGKNWIGRWLII